VIRESCRRLSATDTDERRAAHRSKIARTRPPRGRQVPGTASLAPASKRLMVSLHRPDSDCAMDCSGTDAPRPAGPGHADVDRHHRVATAPPRRGQPPPRNRSWTLPGDPVEEAQHDCGAGGCGHCLRRFVHDVPALEYRPRRDRLGIAPDRLAVTRTADENVQRRHEREARTRARRSLAKSRLRRRFGPLRHGNAHDSERSGGEVSQAPAPTGAVLGHRRPPRQRGRVCGGDPHGLHTRDHPDRPGGPPGCHCVGG